MILNTQYLDTNLLQGVKEVAEILGIVISTDGIPLRAEKINEGLTVDYDPSSAMIGFNRRCEFFRGLGLLVQHAASNPENTLHLSEKAGFETLGAMYDNSRNGVMTIETAKRMIRHMALMGFDMMMLYTEDTFEVKDQPYFGYMRGRFSSDEIKECDRYANLLGIELVPCVQTLAHMNSALRWPVYEKIVDFGDILLAGNEATYQLLDSMFASMAEMFTSRRVNIGMDEAHMLGLGKYLEQNGYRNRSEIMVDHLAKVVEICNKYGFKPMMWSDMFFRMINSSSYGDPSAIPQEIIDKVPNEVTLIHWDYYSVEQEVYDRMLDGHLRFNNEIMFAGGAWKWIGFAPGNQFSFKSTRVALKSCNKKKINQVMVTAWGDDGAECSVFSILPVLQLYAESCYQPDGSDEALAARFKVCTGGELEDFMALDLPNLLPGNEAPGQRYINPSKYLFYQDVLMGLLDRHVEIGEYTRHFVEAAAQLKEGAKRNPQWSYIFLNLERFCKVLEIKSDLGLRLRKAYQEEDRDALRTMMEKDIPELYARINAFYESFESQWRNENKIFGFEVQDMRLGGLLARVHAAGKRLDEYLSGTITVIDELEEDRLFFDCRTDEDLPRTIPAYSWKSVVTVGNT